MNDLLPATGTARFGARISTAGAAREYALAGRAVLTVVSGATGSHVTFKVRRSKRDGSPFWFVDARTGSQEIADDRKLWRLIGTISPRGYADARKPKLPAGAPAIRAARWFFSRLLGSTATIEGVEVWHEGACGRCGRALTDPVSIARGIGPECIKRLSGGALRGSAGHRMDVHAQ